MPARRQRTGGYRKRQVRTPGGRTSQHYRGKRPGVARCASCGRPLGGVPSLSRSRIVRFPHSSRKPNRPFAGYLCVGCSRRAMREMARA